MRACYEGHVDIVQYLLEQSDIEINHRDAVSDSFFFVLSRSMNCFMPLS